MADQPHAPQTVTIPLTPPPVESLVAAGDVDALCDRYEAAWRRGEMPNLDAWLSPGGPMRKAALIELVRVELEYRRRAGEAATVEDYIRRYPELRDDDSAFSRLTGAATAKQAVDSGATSAFNQPAAEPAARVAPTVPGYEILGELGRGGMGVVYKAQQVKLHRVVALKMVLAGAHAGPEQLARFQTEAEAVARLHHANVVQIYEVGEHDGLPFFSLEYVDGGSLAARIGGKPQPPGDAARLVERLADAMDSAHRQNIIHRDLKPANVLLTTDGEPKITDFGLAKRLEGDSGQTRSGTLMGTPSYMAPEQARGDAKNVGPLSDVYALGAILFEMLTGRPPFQGATIVEVLDQVQNQEPVPPSRLRPKLARDLETICLKCLQKEPHQRYATAGDLAADLRRFLGGESIMARPVGWFEKAWRWRQRNPRVAMLTAAVVLLFLTAGAAFTVLWVRNNWEQQAAQERTVREQKAIDETRKAALERLELARAAIAPGDHQRAGTLLSSPDPLLESAPPLQDVRDQWAALRSQVEIYAKFKKLLDDARFASRFGSRRQKEQAQKDCRELVEMDEQIEARTGRWAAGLPPLNAEQQQLFQEDRFEVYLIAALVETDLAVNADAAAKQAAARRAIDWLNRADQILPGLRVTYTNRANYWGVIGNQAEDEADMQRATAIVPTSAVDHFWHGFADHLRAEGARRKGDKKGAEDLLRQEIAEYAALVQLRPDNFWGYFNWANCQVDLGNLHDALIGFTACIRIRPDFPWPYNNRGTIHLRLGEFEQAIEDYNTALQCNADYVEAYANRGLVHIKLGQDAAALADLNRAVEIGSDYAPAYEYRADVHRGRTEYGEAIADCERLLAITPATDQGPVYVKLMEVHHAMGRDEDAVKDRTQALTLLYKRAGLRVARQEYALAVQDYSAMLALNSKLFEPRHDRATVNLVYLKDFDASLADWEELVKLFPKVAEPYYYIGVIHLGRRQYDDARTALEKAVQLKPDYAQAYWALAQIAAWKGDLKEALSIIDPVAEKLPTGPPETLNVRGDIYKAMGRLEDAAADYRRLIALKPDLVETYVSLALVLEKQGKPELAKECFEKLAAANPDSARAYLRRAEFRRSHGQFEAAREDCVRARDKDPKSLLPGLVEASILAAQGSAEEAVAKAESLLAQAPKGDGQILYTAACTWSLASRAAAADPAKAKAAELTKRYADRAAALLAECLEKGFHDLIYPEHNRMVDDPALEPVHCDPRVSDLVEHRP